LKSGVAKSQLNADVLEEAVGSLVEGSEFTKRSIPQFNFKSCRMKKQLSAQIFEKMFRHDHFTKRVICPHHTPLNPYITLPFGYEETTSFSDV